MKFLSFPKRLLTSLWKLLKGQGAFIVFMYVLGLVVTYALVPDKRGYHAYSLAPVELFFDVTLLALLLGLLPARIGCWLKRICYTIAYLLAIVDVYCFVKFSSTITPTMLLLVGETDGREASEFLSSYLTSDVLFTRLGWVVLVLMVHAAWYFVWRYRAKIKYWISARFPSMVYNLKKATCMKPVASLIVAIAWIVCGCFSWHNKEAMVRLLSYDNIGDVEHELTEKHCAVLYQPVYQLVFSIYANELTAKQITKLTANINKIEVDSCSYRSPNIVLIIGESYNRHHAGMYGYPLNTTPRQARRAKTGELTPFTDVVAPWNLTSFVFKHLFSLYAVGDKGEWCDYPLFPEVFRKAGYHVTFLTNQFLPQAKEAVYDFSGGFFLNNPQLSHAQFDTRNTQLYRYDDKLVEEYDKLKNEDKQHNLIIFHLKGQHVDYHTRFPKKQAKFTADDYHRPELGDKELRVLSAYDNAVLYNDSIVDQIIRRFENQNAIVIYVPDHGEECYEGNVHFYGRMHSTEITARLAREEFDIPFWIWCSRKYRATHPDVYRAIRAARNKRYMTDALAHTLLYLGGIKTPYYRPQLDILSKQYNENRPRILKHTTDYDKLNVKK